MHGRDHGKLYSVYAVCLLGEDCHILPHLRGLSLCMSKSIYISHVMARDENALRPISSFEVFIHLIMHCNDRGHS